MRDYLLFRLYGPMSAWGDIAVGERRPTWNRPSKSAVLGLVAGALGLKRDDEMELGTLHQGLGFATRVDAPGLLLSDYHTAQTAPEKVHRKHRLNSRRTELGVGRQALSTILSRRDYLCDAVSAVCLWRLGHDAPGLDTIQAALTHPTFCLYLGRKSCPLALPLHPYIVTAEHAVGALRVARFGDEVFLTRPELDLTARTYAWESELGSPRSSGIIVRRDSADSRLQWLFSDREEHVAREEDLDHVP